jgi:3-dehydroquinate dehydratase/shikimate dehydrogenase
MRRDMFAAAAAGADAVELRLDYLQIPPARQEIADLLAGAPVETIVTCRPTAEGGKFRGPESDRLAILANAVRLGADWVDVEAAVTPHYWPASVGRVILSLHDFKRCPPDLDDIAARLDGSEAAVNKIAFAAAEPRDALRAFDVLRNCRKPTLVLAMGQAGLVSRILGGKFGAFGTFAALAHGKESAPGQPTIRELTDLYRVKSLTPASAVYGVIGCPIAHSMSPAIHNAAFAAAGMDACYVPLLIEPGPDDFRRFMDALLARTWMDCRGLSVTIPHKEHALRYVGADNCDSLAVRIGAVNTITIAPDGSLAGDNTDYAGAIDSLVAGMAIAREDLAGRRAAVLGAGGVARAIVAALMHYGCELTVYNRTVKRGRQLAEEFGAAFDGLDNLDRLDAEIVINCTSIGMYPDVDCSPLAPLVKIPPCVKAVFDTIYNPVETRLIRQARAAGCAAITGLDMFVNQAVAQFERWTAKPAPRQVMREVVARKLGACNENE